MAQEAVKRRTLEILKILHREYPEAECRLLFQNPFQLLVATMLSAQCTDDRVNQVTPELFRTFPGPLEMSRASQAELEKLIGSVNFFRNKSKALRETAQLLVEKHHGDVPADLESLVHLRGVGRKTANVVLGVGFGIPSLVVDTHVGRLSRRLGLTRHSDPEKVEKELHSLVPHENWTEYAHLMIAHGRKICTARKAHCEGCPLSHFCPKRGVAS
jgi:endonuclease-3